MSEEMAANDRLTELIIREFPQTNEKYEFWDYRKIFPDFSELEYLHFADFIKSKRSINDRNDEDRHGLYLNVLFSFPPTSLIERFFWSMPILSYKIENVLSLPFNARCTKSATSDQSGEIKIFKDELKLRMDPEYIEIISDAEIKETLYEVFKKTNSGSELRSCFQTYKALVKPSEQRIRRSFGDIIDVYGSIFGVEVEDNVSVRIAGSPLVPEDVELSGILKPDMVIKKDGRSILPVELKIPTLFEMSERNYPTKYSLCLEKMESIILQLQTYMIVTKTRYGILTDGYYLVVIEFCLDQKKFNTKESEMPENSGNLDLQAYDVHKIKLNEDENLTIPFKTKIVNVNSSCPTFLEMLLYVFYKASEDKGASDFYKNLPIPIKLNENNPMANEKLEGTPEEQILPNKDSSVDDSSVEKFPGEDSSDQDPSLQESNNRGETSKAQPKSKDPDNGKRHGKDQGQGSSTKRRKTRSTSKNDKVVKKFFNYKTNAGFLQSSMLHFTVVYKLKAKYLKDVLEENIDDDEFVVVKIFDPLRYHRHHWLEKRNTALEEKLVRQCYTNEKKAREKVRHAQGYNNIYLKHKEVEVTYQPGLGKVVNGRAIISRYIDTKEIPNTLKFYRRAKRQLKALHKAGVIHGDVRKPNMLYDDKLYLFDFSHASCIDELGAEAEKKKEKDFKMLKEAFQEAFKLFNNTSNDGDKVTEVVGAMRRNATLRLQS